MKLQAKILLLVFCPLILQIAILLEISHLFYDAQDALNQQIQITRIQFLSSSLQKDLGQCLSFAFMYRMTGKDEFAQRLTAELKDFIPLSEKLYASLEAVNYSPESLALLRNLVDKTVEMGNKILVDDPTSRYKSERVAYMKTAVPTMKALSEEGGRIDVFAQELNHDPMSAIHARDRVVIFIYIAFAADLALALGLGLAFLKNIVNRIRILKDNTVKFAIDKPLNDLVGGADEIAELDSFFRMMTISLNDSNRRQKALLENTTDILCSIDKDGRFVSANAAVKKIWGFEPGAILHKQALLTIKKSDRDATHRHLQKAVESSSPQVFDSTTVTVNGSEAEMRWSVIWSETDKSLFCVVRDVSRENELARMKQALMDTAAHDLRAPLTAMVGTLSNLALGVAGPLSDGVKVKIEKTEKQAMRLVRLVSDLLDNEALAAGKMTYVKELTELKPLIVDSIASLQSVADSKNIDILVDAPDGVSALIDKDRIVQVIINLLSNAIKYSEKGTAITINLTPDADLVKLKVIDTGKGIDDSRKEKIFDRFAASDSKERSSAVKTLKGDQQASSGLGLSISKKIIEDNGGQIGVDDTPGGGSTFWFVIHNGG